MSNGYRKELCALSYPAFELSFSPGGRFITWYDYHQKSYCSYELSTGKTSLISRTGGGNHWYCREGEKRIS